MRLPPRLDPAVWRAGLWAWRARRRLVGELRTRGLGFGPVRPAPRLPARAQRGVVAALSRSGATCLERAAVLQAWEAAHQRQRDVVIGVTAPSSGFRAHAWLDGDERCHESEFTELLRLAPR